MREITPLRPTAGALAPTGLTVQEQRRIRDALDSSTSANTRRAYNKGWRRSKPRWRSTASRPFVKGGGKVDHVGGSAG